MDNTLLVDVLAGITGGFASVFVGQPLDTVKVKMQLFPKMYGGMFSCLSNTVRQQGFFGLYAGMLPALVSNGADEAVMFGTYGQCQKIVAKSVGANDTTDLNYIENAAAGSIASFFSASVLCPTELIKIRMQGISNEVTANEKLQDQTTGQVFKKIWKSEGFKGLYRGLGCTIVREFIGCSIFFGVYERSRELLKPEGKRKENCDALATMMAGSLAGICTSLIIYPIDVIKSRAQMAIKDNEFQMIKNEILSNGSRGLYSGLLPTIVKTIPVTGVLLLTVEFSKPFYRKYLSEIPNSLSSVSYQKFFSICDFISGWTAGLLYK
uniref:Mitochondrial ornithine transporter 1 n=1 Tax=Schizaphis graminum TaxID=13262 RepID=A0A2S2NMN1_SCHGA